MKISILIPSWNSEHFIARALKSIISNSHTDLEVRVMDNLSTDKTEQIIKDLKDNRIIFTSQKDSSMYEALNKGIHSAKGEIIGWLGCDDYYEKDTLETVAALFKKNPKVNWIAGNGRFVFEDQDGNVTKSYIHEITKNIDLKTILKMNPLISPSVFFRKSFFEEVGGFDQNYKLAADYGLWLKFALKEKPLQTTKTLSNFSFNGQNASSKKKIQMYQETISIIRSQKDSRTFPYKYANWGRMEAYILVNRLREIRKTK